MKLEKDIILNMPPPQALQRAAQFLTQAGYRSLGGEKAMEFQRGSLRGSLLGFSPRAWKAVARLRPSEDSNGLTLHVELDIQTIGQIVTEKERRFWEAEMSALAAAVLGEQILPAAHTEIAKSALKQNLWLVVVLLAILIPLGFAWGFVANMLFDSRWIARLGAIIIVLLALVVAAKRLQSG